MTNNSSKVTIDRYPIREVDYKYQLSPSDGAFLDICELVNCGDEEAASDSFYRNYEHICRLLRKVDFEATSDSLDMDLSDLIELRSRLRTGVIRGLTALIGFTCLLLGSFAALTL